MYALFGRVEIKPGHEDETAAMARDHGPTIVGGLPGSKQAFWARALDDSSKLVQHSFWLFDDEDGARAAEAGFNSLRDMPDAPAVFISADVCEIIAYV